MFYGHRKSKYSRVKYEILFLQRERNNFVIVPMSYYKNVLCKSNFGDYEDNYGDDRNF